MIKVTSRQDRLWRLALFTPTILVYVLFFAVPVLSMLPISFKGYQPGVGILDTFTTEHYAKVIMDPWYRGIVLRTLGLGLVVATIDTALAWPIAYFLVRSRSRLRAWLLLIVVFPLFLNLVVRSFGWIALLSNRGLINQALIASGMSDHPIRLIFNFTGILIGLTHIYLPFSVLVLVAAIRNIPAEIEAAAISLGSSAGRAILDVALPLSRPGMISSFLLVFVLTISALVTPRLLGGSNYQVMSTLIYEEFMVLLNWPSGAALSFVLLVVVLVVIALPVALGLSRRRALAPG